MWGRGGLTARCDESALPPFRVCVFHIFVQRFSVLIKFFFLLVDGHGIASQRSVESLRQVTMRGCT